MAFKLNPELQALGAEWKNRLAEAEAERAKEEPKWLQLYRLWRGIPPSLPKTQVGKRANIFVPFIFPVIMTIQAREMMYFMGTSANLTVKIAGASKKEEIRQLQLRAQNSMEFLFAQPYRFTQQYNINQDRLIYGYCPSKLMSTNDYNVFRSELIHPWNFLYDPRVREWCDIGWAAHWKVVPIFYLQDKEPYIQEVVKAIAEGEITLDKRYPHHPQKGILLTEVWDKESKKMFALVNNETVVRAPEEFKRFPYLLHIDNPESLKIPAIGESELAKWLQLELNILRNQILDNVKRRAHDILLCPPGVNKWELQNARSGGVINWDGTTKPEAVPFTDATRNLEFKGVEHFKDEIRWLTGVLPGTTGEMLSKRMTTPEVSTMNLGTGSRFWLREKVAEDHYWKPLGDGIMELLVEAPKDFFAECASMGNDYDDKLKPSDLKKYDVQIQPRMSEDIRNDMYLRETVLTALKIGGIAWPDWIDRGKALDVFLDAFRDCPGIRQIFANRPQETASMEEQSATLEEVLNKLRAQPGQEKLTTA
jgi:hypothetical protein